MPRYFYLLCLLISINWTFCYDYIPDRNPQTNRGERLSKKVKNRITRRGDKYFHKKRQKYEMVEDKDPTAQIDVASFIQKPDEYAIDDNLPYEMENKGRKTKLESENDYGSLLAYNPDEYTIKRSNERPYYLNPGSENFDFDSSRPLKGAINSRRVSLDSVSSHRSSIGNGKIPRNMGDKLSLDNYQHGFYDENSIHKPAKKSVLKYMKFPFFSHNKTEMPKAKKAKKRKVFCFNCSKKEKSDDQSSNNGLKDRKKITNLESPSNIAMNDVGENSNTKTARGKRDDWTNANDRERQLKELEEIQRKVDSVEIASTYHKAP